MGCNSGFIGFRNDGQIKFDEYLTFECGSGLKCSLFSADKLSARGIDQSAVVFDENSDNSAVSSVDAQNDQNSDPDGN